MSTLAVRPLRANRWGSIRFRSATADWQSREHSEHILCFVPTEHEAPGWQTRLAPDEKRATRAIECLSHLVQRRLLICGLEPQRDYRHKIGVIVAEALQSESLSPGAV
jgi:hypothetical protein